MKNDTQHWTSDPDLLKQYVLGKLSPEDRSTLEDHLRQCEHCRAEVDLETRIATEVRAFGRTELKARLKNRIEKGNVTEGYAVRPGKAAWFGGFATAAVLVIAVGLGIYNGWFSRQASEGLSVQETVKPDSVGAHSASRAAPERLHGLAVDQEQAQTKSIDIQVSPSTGQGAGVAAAPLQGIKKDEGAKSISLDDLARSKPRGPSSVTPNGVWLEGVEVASRRASDFGAGAEKSTLRDSKQKREPGVVLLQRPWQSLPLERQQAQAMSKRQTIQTFLSLERGRLQLILFGESKLSDSELKSAQVRFITRDSVVVQLSSKMILYRFPPGFAGEGP